MTFRKTIRSIRRSKELTQSEIAHKCGICTTYLSMIEIGKRMPPDNRLIRKIAAALGEADRADELCKLARAEAEEGRIRNAVAPLPEKMRSAILQLSQRPADNPIWDEVLDLLKSA